MSSGESKSLYHLVTMIQAGKFYRYTNWPENSDGYTPVAEMELELPELTGSLEAEDGEITLDADAFTESLRINGIHAPVRVTVVEIQVDPDGAIVSQGPVFTGNISQVLTAPEGKPSQHRLVCRGVKARLGSILNLPIQDTCPYRFLKNGCFLDIADFTYTGTLSSVDEENHLAVISGLPSVPADQWFTDGYIELGAVRIHLRYWSEASPGLFYVSVLPDPSWIGQELTVVAGCPRTVQACRDRDNEEHFGGIGLKMPAYVPVYETGSYENETSS